jgi:hypothetical protein
MIDDRVKDGMIEIGDPTEEAVPAVLPPQVVIEYRERGVPWMLIPPLLVISAVGAIIAYHKYAPPNARFQPTTVAKAPTAEVAKAPTAEVVKTPSAEGYPIPAFPAAPPVEKPEEPFTVVSSAVNGETLPPEVAKPADEPPTQTEKPAEPPPFPRVQSLGFDPKALEDERKAEATGDGSLKPASKDARPDQPAPETDRVANPAAPEQAREVAPGVLPPDPRLARIRQQQRLAEIMQLNEADRARFHADLKQICRSYSKNWPQEMGDLNKRYATELEPAIKKQAVHLLGQTGAFAGADRETRIDVLRAIGFPEPMILEDVFTTYEQSRISMRDGPRNGDEAMYRAALYLLKHPPGRRASTRVDVFSRARSAAPAQPPGTGVR